MSTTYRLTRHGGPIGREVAAGSELFALLGPREVLRRRREERALARLWPGRAVNARIWADAARRLDVEFRDLGDGFFELGSGDAGLRVWMHVPPIDPESARRRTLDKTLSQRLIAEAGAPVPAQVPFGIDDLKPAEAALDGGFWVVKPAGGTSSGQGATTGVRSLSDLRRAAVRAARSDRRLLLERQASGAEYRVLLLDGEPIGAVRRDAPTVTGDGKSTVAELVHGENRRRLEAVGEAGLDVIRLDLDALLALERLGLGLRSVPAAGRRIAVKGSHSQAGAGDVETIPPASVSAELVAELAGAVETFGLRLAGIDLVTPDIGSSLAAVGGAVIEINGTPGLHYHYLVRDPATATPVAVPLLEAMLSE